MTDRPIVLLRGLIREQRHWGDFPTRLRRQLPDRTVITLDLPGNGTLYQRTSPCSIPALTESLRTQLHARCICARIELVAISMGGMIALDWMTRYPAEVDGAALINTSSRHAPFYRRLRWQNYGALLALLGLDPARRERKILALTSNRHGRDSVLLQQWRDWQRQYPVSRQNALRQILAAATFKLERKPDRPLLLIASRADRLVDYRCSAVLATDWNLAYREHPTAGHDLPLDDPQWLADTVSDWLSSR